MNPDKLDLYIEEARREFKNQEEERREHRQKSYAVIAFVGMFIPSLLSIFGVNELLVCSFITLNSPVCIKPIVVYLFTLAILAYNFYLIFFSLDYKEFSVKNIDPKNTTNSSLKNKKQIFNSHKSTIKENEDMNDILRERVIYFRNGSVILIVQLIFGYSSIPAIKYLSFVLGLYALHLLIKLKKSRD